MGRGAVTGRKRVAVFLAMTLSAMLAFPGLAAEKVVTPGNNSGDAAYEVHEWGVVVGCENSRNYALTARPLPMMVVKEPVLYFHSQDKKPFALKVTFNQGTPTDTYPEAAKNGNTLQWKRVTFPTATASSTAKGFETDDGLVPFNAIVNTLNNVDADEVEAGGVKARFLYYEGQIPFANPVKATFDLEKKEATVANDGSYPVFDLFVLIPEGMGWQALFEPQDPFLAYLPQLQPGETVRVKLDPVLQKVDFGKSLRTLGFTEKESAAFALLWSESILKSGKLFYRLPQSECERMITLEFNPRPQKISRALYVLLEN